MRDIYLLTIPAADIYQTQAQVESHTKQSKAWLGPSNIFVSSS